MFFLLKDPIVKLPGIGPNLSEKFGKLDIFTIQDLIHHYPRRWEDFSQITDINKIKKGKNTIKATLISLDSFRSPHRRLAITNALVQDTTGSLQIIWFNQPYLANMLEKKITYFISGTVSNYQGKLTLVNPVIEPADSTPLHSGRIVPIYPTTEGVTSRLIRKIFKYLTNTISAIPEILPKDTLKQHRFIGLSQALKNIHSPSSMSALKKAKQRLSVEELIPIHLSLMIAKQQWEQLDSLKIPIKKEFLKTFTNQLEFKLTPSQKQALNEILLDLQNDYPMNRLLLGDVGTGKTVIAAGAIVATVQVGFQAALMAPTEVLAVQHYQSLQPLMKKFGITTTLLTGSIKLSDGTDIKDGKVDLIIGTHALIQQGLTFKQLNLVIIDEQHRFGVRQRQQLKNKAQTSTPHFMSMSATPIPRTLFLGLLKDLDISQLTHAIKGRLPVITRLVTPNNKSRVQQLIQKEIKVNHQIFVVVPLVEDSHTISERVSVTSETKKLAQMFPQATLATLHGRMKSEDKLANLDKLQKGKIDILLATSVIEVGLDIPAATVIWIKNADRFGLAQLHQLRGRVGRSSIQSYCLIETASDDSQTLERLKSFIHINDGTKLAETDLKLRGPGSFFGEKQSGLFKLRLADLNDIKLIQKTRSIAEEILKTDPLLKKHPLLKKKLQFNLVSHKE